MTKATSPIRIAISGIGNCASALVQGLAYYSAGRNPDAEKGEHGLAHRSIGGWGCGNIDVVAAFDIDARKVGRPLGEAIFSPPNCVQVFQPAVSPGVMVMMGPPLDGIAPHMADYPDERAFRLSGARPVDIAATLAAARVDILVSYMPVGADGAARHYAQACLDAGVAMINCSPSFIASDSAWAEKFRRRGIPIIGDDIKSQLGATIVHRALARLFADRGISVSQTYQLNTGGNTDFLNMLARDRLASKKISKTNSVQSQFNESLCENDIHVGPSDYIPWLKDNKVCFIRMNGEGFGGAPIELDLKLSVQDSPNSAGVVIDAIRCAALGRRRGMAGPLEVPSAYFMKSPPIQMRDSDALDRLNIFLAEDD